MNSYTILDTPFGDLWVGGPADGGPISHVSFPSQRVQRPPAEEWEHRQDHHGEGRRQIAAYLAGDSKAFDLPLYLDGTPFQQEVWAALQEIPSGETWSYAQLADHIGRPNAVRAVGSANGRNPLPVLVPCHRVIGADGTLTGYLGGTDIKRYLLELEGWVQRSDSSAQKVLI